MVAGSWAESRRAFADAARWFVATAAFVGDRWERPGLGEWDIRALVGHTSRSLLTVEAYLARPADAIAITTPEDYVRTTRLLAADAAVAARGAEAGTALGDDPAAAVSAIADRVVPLVDGCAGHELVTTIVGGMRLDAYLPTRTFELVVHTCDLCDAIEVPMEVPPRAAAAALELVTGIAVTDGLAGPLLLGATGRELPRGYSVL